MISEDNIFNGFVYNLDMPVFIMINRSKYGKGVGFKHEILEYKGKNCYIPTRGYCFIKRINYLTGLDYMESYLEFIRNEKRRSNVKTQACIEPCCKAFDINIGYYNGKKLYPGMVTERNKALYLYRNRFCLTWKSERISSNEAIKQLKSILKNI